MKDAVGSTMLVYIVVIVVGVVGSILIASNMYTSAYKAKNNIVSIIDKYYMVNGKDCFVAGGVCTNSIDGTLKNMGYHVNEDNLCNVKILTKVTKKAKDDEGNDVSMTSLAYEGNGYCIYRTNLYNSSYYYTVVTFSHLNINAFNIGSLFSTPVYGETRTYYNS